MSRSNQQLVRLIQELIRAVQTGKLKIRWIVALVVLVAGYFLLQPVLERSLGVDLPGLGSTNNSPSTSKPSADKPAPRQADVSTPGELEKILHSGSRAPYVSPVPVCAIRAAASKDIG